MNWGYGLCLVIGGIAFLGFILGLIMRRRLRERYALIWIFLGFSIILLPFFYSLLSWLNSYLELPHTTTLIISLILAGILLICLQLTVAISSLWRKQKELIQHIALLEQQIKEKE